MDDLVHDWEQNAPKLADSNLRFLKSLNAHPNQQTVDETANAAHRQVFDKIDCLQCARCCKSLKPDFEQTDIERTAAHIGMSQPEFIKKYLDQKAYGDYFIKNTPCPFLNDKTCGIYAARPDACRGYPFTGEEHFSKRGLTNSVNAELCPATFHVIKAMQEKLGWADTF